VYRECNVNATEYKELIEHLFEKISKYSQLTHEILPVYMSNIKPINKTSSIGEQIKYYRETGHILQEELGQTIGMTRYSIMHLENDDIKLLDINVLKKVIKALNIEDKIKINDDYINFILDNPIEKIKQYRKKEKITMLELSRKLKVAYTTVKNWENGKTIISRKCYNSFASLE